MTQTKIIVLDDDPTGSQTVHSCLLLTRWDADSLRDALLDNSPLFFVLTNTRGMDAKSAAKLTGDVCRNLKIALAQLADEGIDINPIMVSRSDSTLRGHYPVETDVIAAELGPFDAHFLVPAFFEGGRFTRNATHYLMVDDKAVPVHETEFAKDSVFGFSTAYLPDYVEEKTSGRIKTDQVKQFLLDDVRGNCLARLNDLTDNVCCTVDCENQDDLNHFADQLTAAAATGKRFLFRSGASLLTALAQLPQQPVAAQAMAEYVRDGKPGAVIVGSHVKKTTSQLNELLKQSGIADIEVNVSRILHERDVLLREVLQQAEHAHTQGLTTVIYTSRQELQFADKAARLAFGVEVSELLMDIVRGLPKTIGFLISKGGITSNDVLSTGLTLRAARVVGQILPGCSVVCCPENHKRFPNLPVVIFPGNVGDDSALKTAFRRLSQQEPALATA